jgi:F-type H+-transporting ATPase subunit alpha
VPLEKQVAIIYAGIKGYLDDIPVEELAAWETDFQAFIAERYSGLLHDIAQTGELSEKTSEGLDHAIEEFKAQRK